MVFQSEVRFVLGGDGVVYPSAADCGDRQASEYRCNEERGKYAFWRVCGGNRLRGVAFV